MKIQLVYDILKGMIGSSINSAIQTMAEKLIYLSIDLSKYYNKNLSISLFKILNKNILKSMKTSSSSYHMNAPLHNNCLFHNTYNKLNTYKTSLIIKFTFIFVTSFCSIYKICATSSSFFLTMGLSTIILFYNVHFCSFTLCIHSLLLFYFVLRSNNKSTQ